MTNFRNRRVWAKCFCLQYCDASRRRSWNLPVRHMCAKSHVLLEILAKAQKTVAQKNVLFGQNATLYSMFVPPSVEHATSRSAICVKNQDLPKKQLRGKMPCSDAKCTQFRPQSAIFRTKKRYKTREKTPKRQIDPSSPPQAGNSH